MVPLGNVRQPWDSCGGQVVFLRTANKRLSILWRFVWWAGEFWLLLSVPFRYWLYYLSSDQLLNQQLSSAKCVGPSPLLSGTWSIICSAGCAHRPSLLTRAATLLTSLPDLDEPVLTVHQTISDVRGSFYQEKTVFLRCTVNSNPPARFIWKRGAETLSHSQDNGVDIYEPLYTQVKISKPLTACVECLADEGLQSGWCFLPCMDCDAGERVQAAAESTASRRAGRPSFCMQIPRVQEEQSSSMDCGLGGSFPFCHCPWEQWHCSPTEVMQLFDSWD